MSGQIRTGIGGWTFEPWRGVFYPPGLAQDRELEFLNLLLAESRGRPAVGEHEGLLLGLAAHCILEAAKAAGFELPEQGQGERERLGHVVRRRAPQVHR